MAKLEGRRPYQMRSRIGMSIPLHSTAIGKAALAALPAAQCEEVVSRLDLTPMTEHSLGSKAALRRQLAQARAEGVAFDRGENDPGICCMGAAVFDYTGSVLGGVSVSALKFDIDLEDPAITDAVRTTAHEVSRALGAPEQAAGAASG